MLVAADTSGFGWACPSPGAAMSRRITRRRRPFRVRSRRFAVFWT